MASSRLDVYYKFWSLCNAVKAQPMIYVSYLREIYEGENDEELAGHVRPARQRHAGPGTRTAELRSGHGV